MPHRFLGLLTACTLIGLATPAHAQTYAANNDDESSIFGGELAPTCAWPSTVYVNDCTGSLVHPEVVMFAAHCILLGGQNPSEVVFGEDSMQPERSVATVDCDVNPDFSLDDGPGDWAYCTLAEPVEDVPRVPILMGCETEQLQVGSEVVLAGFGFADSQPDYGLKRHVTTTVQEFFGDNEIILGGNGMSSCYGDSGGPAFLQMEDGSWRVFGITSRGTSQECGEPAIYGLMHAGAVQWVEAETMIDITPCTDADGTWNPGPDCGGFPLDAHLGGGEWAQGCVSDEVSGFSDACGDPFDDSGTDTDTDTDTGESDTDTDTDATDSDVGTDSDATDSSDAGTETGMETAGPTETTGDPSGTETGDPSGTTDVGGTDVTIDPDSDSAGGTGGGTTITCTCTQAEEPTPLTYGLLGLAGIVLLGLRRRR